MPDDREMVHAMTREIQAAILPVIGGARADILMPAMIQATISLAMFVNSCGPREAVDSIIATMEEAKRNGAN